MFKIPKQEYTPEFKELAVKRVTGGQGIAAVAKDLGLVEQTLRNWVKAAKAGKLNPPGANSDTILKGTFRRAIADRLYRRGVTPPPAGRPQGPGSSRTSWCGRPGDPTITVTSPPLPSVAGARQRPDPPLGAKARLARCLEQQRGRAERADAGLAHVPPPPSRTFSR